MRLFVVVLAFVLLFRSTIGFSEEEIAESTPSALGPNVRLKLDYVRTMAPECYPDAGYNITALPEGWCDPVDVKDLYEDRKFDSFMDRIRSEREKKAAERRKKKKHDDIFDKDGFRRKDSLLPNEKERLKKKLRETSTIEGASGVMHMYSAQDRAAFLQAPRAWNCHLEFEGSYTCRAAVFNENMSKVGYRGEQKGGIPDGYGVMTERIPISGILTRNSDGHEKHSRFMEPVFEAKGKFVEGIMTGKFVITWDDGDVWEGKFKEGKLHGLWRESTIDGLLYESWWNRGALLVQEPCALHAWCSQKLEFCDPSLQQFIDMQIHELTNLVWS